MPRTCTILSTFCDLMLTRQQKFSFRLVSHESALAVVGWDLLVRLGDWGRGQEGAQGGRTPRWRRQW
jgi:hypothetical protein